MIEWILIGVALFLIGIAFLNTYNSLVKKDVDILEQIGVINTTLQKRSDLLMGLGDLGNVSKDFEGSTHARVARLRSAGKSGGIYASAEETPDLKSMKNFERIQEELSGVERLLKQARDDYNSLVGEFKVYVRSFPVIIVSSIIGYSQNRYDFFNSMETKRPDFIKERNGN